VRARSADLSAGNSNGTRRNRSSRGAERDSVSLILVDAQLESSGQHPVAGYAAKEPEILGHPLNLYHHQASPSSPKRDGTATRVAKPFVPGGWIAAEEPMGAAIHARRHPFLPPWQKRRRFCRHRICFRPHARRAGLT
jgi:hypothetical protein